MRRIGLMVVLVVGLVLMPLAVAAQQAGKVYRIGWLAPAPLPTTLDSFRDGLRALGYAEGNNFTVEERYAMRKAERFAPLVEQLVRANVDLIVTTGNEATAAAKATALA